MGSSRAERPSRLPAVIAALAVAVLLWPLTLIGAPAGSPSFPRQLSTYSWWTPMLGAAQIEAAAMTYQNGVGVEFLDVPQAVVLGADGATYRRLGAAEERSVAADQGDPADSVLSADGTFVVISAPGRQAGVELLDLSTLSSRIVPITGAASAVALSIDSAGETVLLLTSDDDMSRYTDAEFRLYGTLATLDLASGELRTLPLETRPGFRPTAVQSGAVSPDGRRIAAQTGDALLILDAVDGSATHELAPLAGILDGDAWSPDGTRLAAVGTAALRVIDVVGEGVEERVLPLPADRWSSMLGWRDDRTALLHLSSADDSNDSGFAWLDVETGELDAFSSYPADPLTGAALGSADVARDLVAEWEVVDRPAGSPITVLHVLLFSALAGLVVWTVTSARAREPRLR
ncbi:hypothetical protein GRS96_02070 [Rathayibacter sp. VKM Ac-2803]|uniref:hypothetical protein n=1 Tax=unclassified Rathayibacter TaxID=2609250 RepID=UPI00135905D0|nr:MULTISPECIES: hypothetical protein [unclassified Rathayibacter]MWV48060.1 hypothetical protein [Rathayibacter sp. VKM Ac-2803]MWV58719.1 hypothetical protein [Rathayibacter sp. VKM Ac-2754]